jgi:hypothetical protein
MVALVATIHAFSTECAASTVQGEDPRNKCKDDGVRRALDSAHKTSRGNLEGAKNFIREEREHIASGDKGRCYLTKHADLCALPLGL